MSDTQNAVVVEENRVIIYDELATDVIYDVIWSDTPNLEAFADQFDTVAGFFFANPAEDYYQGVGRMALIKRQSDGRLFGFSYWQPIAKHGEAQVEPNGDEHGFAFDPPDDFDWNDGYYPQVYVWLPVEPFSITGYKITKESN